MLYFGLPAKAALRKGLGVMARFTIYKDNYVDSTVISNCFIDEYMKDANDAQLKVYLYLIRMLNANQATSVSEIADRFNHTEKDVNRALKYWEKKNLLELDYDDDRNLVGIHLRDLNAPADAAARTSGIALTPSGMPAGMTTMPESAPAAADFVKPSYTASQLREFKSREQTAQLLFIAESYIGKPLTPSEMKSILFFTDVLHFSDDLIDYLLQYCVDRGKRDFKYIEKVAINWAQEGISTPKQAQRYSTRRSDEISQKRHAAGARQAASANKFNQFAQNQYDFDALEKELLSN